MIEKGRMRLNGRRIQQTDIQKGEKQSKRTSIYWNISIAFEQGLLHPDNEHINL